VYERIYESDLDPKWTARICDGSQSPTSEFEERRLRALLEHQIEYFEDFSRKYLAKHSMTQSEPHLAAEIATTRYRMINGSAVEVLPRLTDGAYDLVFVDADKSAYTTYHEQAVRLLRSGGVVAFDNALWHDRVADNTARDAETVTIREMGKAVRDDPRLVSAMLPVGDGLLAAVKL